ncbi:MAG: hypothetical protein H6Q14_671 [Bacteroidetes bacterium]|nr:hypothetical protein [Bacteroidota bacterium]
MKLGNRSPLYFNGTSIESDLYLDYRIIKADNVALQIQANSLIFKRTEEHQKRLTSAIDKKGRKLDETTDAEENLLNKQQDADNAIITNLSLEDQLNYSTITLMIYQKQGVQHGLAENEQNVKEYEPHIGLKYFMPSKIVGICYNQSLLSSLISGH